MSNAATASDPVVGPKSVSWQELFFDLVFVFAVTRTAELLHEDHSWTGVLRALIVFMPVYWVWVGTTMHANMHDIETRLGAAAACLVFLAVGTAMSALVSVGLLAGVLIVTNIVEAYVVPRTLHRAGP